MCDWADLASRKSDTRWEMEDVFKICTLVFVISIVASMVEIFRDVLPHLNEDDQGFLRGWFTSDGRRLGMRETLSRHVRFDRLIGRVWNQHVRLFPNSRKRIIFACLFVGSLLSVFAYPLWLAVGPR